MAGLKICTRCRAISARRRRRISSSLLPENIGPTITSIQPILPLTMSTFAPQFDSPSIPEVMNLDRAALTNRAGCPHGSRAVHLCIIERGEGGNRGDAKRFLPGNQVVRQDSPSSLRVTDSIHIGKAVDGHGKLDAVVENFADERLRKLDPARAAVVASRAIRNISPALQENAAARVGRHIGMPPRGNGRSCLENDIESSFQSDEVIPEQAVLLRNLRKRFGALPRATHQFFLGRRCGPYTASHFHSNQLEFGAGGKRWGENF